MSKNGYWKYENLDGYKKYKVTCSVCGASYIDNYDGYIDAENFNYCPNCGTEMSEAENDE